MKEQSLIKSDMTWFALSWIALFVLLSFVFSGCSGPFSNPKRIEVVTLTYPARTFTCRQVYNYYNTCGYIFQNCTEKDTEEFYDEVGCVPALIREAK